MISFSYIVEMRARFLKERGQLPNCLMLPYGTDFWIHSPLGNHQRIVTGDLIAGMEVIFTDDVKYPVAAIRVQRSGTVIYY